MRRKDRLLMSAAACLLLGASVSISPSNVSAIVPGSTIYDPLLQKHLHVVDYEGVPVFNAWDYGVWDKAANGQRLGSLNDAANQLLYITHEVTINNIPLVYFTSPTISGFTAKEAIIPGAMIAGTQVTPASNAWDFGIWTHFQNGRFVANLEAYQNSSLTIAYTIDGWAYVTADGADLGWVSLNGLKEHTVVEDTFYHAFAVSRAGDYGVWSHPSGGQRIAGLEVARQEMLVVTQETYQDGLEKVFIHADSISGWVAKEAVVAGGGPLFNTRATPQYDAWNFGIWSHYAGGSYLGSLDDFYGEELSAPLIAPNDWVLIEYNGQKLGWVYVDGLAFIDESFSAYTGVPVANAWDYSVWSELRDGRRLGSLNDYAQQELTVISVSQDGTMVKFMLGDTVIGWVNAMAIARY